MQERLQKVLASAGVASRRDAESLISSGKVTVNGEVIRELGQKVDPERDYIAVDGKPIPRHVEHLYILLHKPKGYVTTRHDPHATNTVMELVVPALEQRFGRGDAAVAGLHPVGRLDAQSEGLLILTNDGSFTQEMTHPRHRVPKVYVAEVRGIPDADALEKLRTGVPLFGQRTLPARARVVRADRGREIARVEVEIREGRNQQVRRMLQAVGYPVNRLTRVGIGAITLDRLRPGQWRFLTEAEVETLRTRAANPEAEEEMAPPQRPSARRGHGGPGPKRPYTPGGAPRPQGSGGPGRPQTSGGGGRPQTSGGGGRPRAWEDRPRAAEGHGRPPGPGRPQGPGGPGRPRGGEGAGRPQRPAGPGGFGGPERPQGDRGGFGSGSGRPQGDRGGFGRPSGSGRPQGERGEFGRGGGPGRPQGERGGYGAGPARPQGPGPGRPQAPRGPSGFEGRPQTGRPTGKPDRPTGRDTGGPGGRGGQFGGGRPQGGQGRPSFGGRPNSGRGPSGGSQNGRSDRGRGKG